MYRTRMAAARQAVSMDCYYSYQDEDQQNPRTRSQLLGKYVTSSMSLPGFNGWLISNMVSFDFNTDLNINS